MQNQKRGFKGLRFGGQVVGTGGFGGLGVFAHFVFLRTFFYALCFYALRFYALRAWGAVGHVGPTLRRIQCQIEAADGGVEGKAVVEGLEIWFNRKKMLRGFFIS